MKRRDLTKRKEILGAKSGNRKREELEKEVKEKERKERRKEKGRREKEG